MAQMAKTDTTGGNFVDGSLGIVRLYDVALTATEAAQNYAVGRARFGI